MNAIIKQIQKSLENGRPVEIRTSPLGIQVLKEIQKDSSKRIVSWKILKEKSFFLV